MLTLDKGLFRFNRTYVALRRVHESLDKFRTVAAADRYAAVGIAQMDIAATLLEQLGMGGIARDLRQRVHSQKVAAEQAVTLGKRGKRLQVAVGARPAQVAQVNKVLQEAPVPVRRKPGRPRKQQLVESVELQRKVG